MKIVDSWLREWVDPDIDTADLAHQLTMLGLEVDEISVEGEELDGVVVGEVIDVKKHPDADRLSVCEVSTGGKETVAVVCGAPNVVQGMKSPLAVPGVRLPNGLKLRKTKIRGVPSHGMLCSAVELGLGDESDGILQLPEDAPVGVPLPDYLSMPDAVISLDLTPNRGDCFSVLGIAREVAAKTGSDLKSADVVPVEQSIDDILPVEIPLPEGCPSFAGRLIRNIDPEARSPLWMVERLRRAGLRGISPVVDITNYVMLELGQPLHAYDAGLVSGAIRPRLAKDGEKVTLLDEKEVAVNTDTLVWVVSALLSRSGPPTSSSRRRSGHRSSWQGAHVLTACTPTRHFASNEVLTRGARPGLSNGPPNCCCRFRVVRQDPSFIRNRKNTSPRGTRFIFDVIALPACSAPSSRMT
jgi:phenylalanyl-tRNA synthetase beta chain